MRDVILKDYTGKVTYVPEEPAALPVRIQAERQGGTHTISLIGALHGELAPDSVERGDRVFGTNKRAPPPPVRATAALGPMTAIVFTLAGSRGRRPPVFFEQHDTFSGSLERHCTLFGRVNFAAAGVGMLEKAAQEHDAQDAADVVVEGGFRNVSGLDFGQHGSLGSPPPQAVTTNGRPSRPMMRRRRIPMLEVILSSRTTMPKG